MSDIFLSYSRTDEERVRPLAAALEGAGFSVWWDRNLSGGERFSRETEARLNAAKAIVVAWSAAAVESMWVADEATVGRDKGNLIPVSIDGTAPPIGFRQIQTISFDQWRGDAGAACFETLKRSLARTIDPASAAAMQAAPAPPAVVPWTKRRPLVIAAIGAAAAIAIAGVAFVIGGQTTRDDPGAIREAAAQVTRDLALSASADERDVRLAGDAVSAIGASNEPESKSAFARLVAGDSVEAVEILNTLAERLEARGDNEAAAAVYTQIGALALLIDRGRALAARKRAFLLAPESMQAMQGLFLDTYLIQGPDAALAFAKSVRANPNLSERVRAFIISLETIVVVDSYGDLAAARRLQTQFNAIAQRANDPALKSVGFWFESLIALLVDDVPGALATSRQAIDAAADSPTDLPRNGEVSLVRALFAAGDWAAALAEGAAALDRRRQSGDFIAAPILKTSCEAAAYLGRVADAESYCRPLAEWSEARGGGGAKNYAGLLAAAKGDFAAAKSEFAAADALLASNPDSQLDRRVFEAYARARARDFDGAEALLREAAALALENAATRHKNRSFRANAWRMFGATAIAQGEAARACAPLAEAAALYAEIGAEAGVRETERLRAEAGCED